MKAEPAGRGVRSAAPASTRSAAEYTEPARAGAWASAGTSSRIDAGVAELVVEFAFGWFGEDVIGVLNLGELFSSPGFFVDIGVVLLGEPAVSLFDRFGVGLSLDPEHFVKIAWHDAILAMNRRRKCRRGGKRTAEAPRRRERRRREGGEEKLEIRNPKLEEDPTTPDPEGPAI
jgi:hypothetical protein